MPRRRERRKPTQYVREDQPYGPAKEKKPGACNGTYNAEIRAKTKRRYSRNGEMWHALSAIPYQYSEGPEKNQLSGFIPV